MESGKTILSPASAANEGCADQAHGTVELPVLGTVESRLNRQPLPFSVSNRVRSSISGKEKHSPRRVTDPPRATPAPCSWWPLPTSVHATLHRSPWSGTATGPSAVSTVQPATEGRHSSQPLASLASKAMVWVRGAYAASGA